MIWCGDTPFGMVNPRRCPTCKSIEDVSGHFHICSKCHTKIYVKAMNAYPSFINVSQQSFGIIDEHAKMLKLYLDHPKTFWKELEEEIKGCEQVYRGAPRPAVVDDDEIIDAPNLEDYIPELDD